MSYADHEWARENLPAHLAGGLSAEERARMEGHVSGCAECIAELDALRRFERGMDDLFAPVRPRPGLEERVIRGLRAAAARKGMPLATRVGMGVAAALLLGIVGLVILTVEEGGAIMQGRGELLPGVVRLQKAVAGPAESPSDAEEADHNEVVLADAAKPAPPAPPAITTEPPSNRGAETRRYYSYRDEAPSGKAKPPEVGYFKPGEIAKGDAHDRVNMVAGKELVEQEKEKKRVDDVVKDLKAADAGRPELQQAQAAEPQIQRKIIRSGEMEFEIDSFDATVAKITKIAAEERGFVATVNSEKLPNGKVRGSVVVRVPPENLDTLILKLRALGDLKSQRIGSQDVTKLYTDLESRLRAARTMEERLLKIIKDGTGAIKDLLQAEKELGEWRTRIESIEGEIRYYNNLISLSTLTITLYEKEIKSPFGVVETERVQMGIEVEDVEAAQRDALAAVAEARGRVTKSELKQHGPGQLSALIHCEVGPDSAGPLRDRLRRLGNVARLDVQRDQRTEGGSGKPAEAKVRRNDAQFFISLYNLTNVPPRETVHVNLACVDAEKSYKDILARVEKAGGRVVTSSLQQPSKDRTTGTIHFEVKSADADAVLSDLKTYGEVMRLQRAENPDARNVTRSKRGFQCQIFAMGMVAPRETTVVQLACRDVPAAYQSIVAAVRKAEGRILSSGLDERDRHNVTGTIEFEVRRDARKEVDDAMAAAGPVYSRNSTQAQDNENVVDSKTCLRLTLINIERIPPRETHTMSVEVGDVERRMAEVAEMAAEAGGRTADTHVSRHVSGRMEARLALDVPLAAASGVIGRIKGLGNLRSIESARNPAVPESDLAVARLDVTLSNEVILPSDSGPWANIRRGLSVSLVALSWSLALIIIGICFVLPIAAVGWGAWRLLRRSRPSPNC